MVIQNIFILCFNMLKFYLLLYDNELYMPYGSMWSNYEKWGYLRCIKDIKNIIYICTITPSGIEVEQTVGARFREGLKSGRGTSFQIGQAKKGHFGFKVHVYPWLIEQYIYFFLATILQIQLLKKRYMIENAINLPVLSYNYCLVWSFPCTGW